MGKRYSEREMNLPPSQRRYAKHMEVPDGCIDVWRVNAVRVGGQTTIDSQWIDRDLCMARADVLWKKTTEKGTRKEHIHIYVEHKAAMKIGEKYHIVNIPSFTLSEVTTVFPPNAEAVADDDHSQWLAEYTGSCEDADMGGNDCPAGQCCRPGTCRRTDDV